MVHSVIQDLPNSSKMGLGGSSRHTGIPIIGTSILWSTKESKTKILQTGFLITLETPSTLMAIELVSFHISDMDFKAY